MIIEWHGISRCVWRHAGVLYVYTETNISVVVFEDFRSTSSRGHTVGWQMRRYSMWRTYWRAFIYMISRRYAMCTSVVFFHSIEKQTLSSAVVVDGFILYSDNYCVPGEQRRAKAFSRNCENCKTIPTTESRLLNGNAYPQDVSSAKKSFFYGLNKVVFRKQWGNVWRKSHKFR